MSFGLLYIYLLLLLVCVCAKAHIVGSGNNFVERALTLLPSCTGPGVWTQRARHVQHTPLPDELSWQPKSGLL